MHLHAPFRQNAREPPSGSPVVCRQDYRIGAEKMKGRPGRGGGSRRKGAGAGRAITIRKRVLYRERQLDSRSAGAHHGDAQRLIARPDACRQPLPSGDQPADRLDGNGVIRRPFHADRRRDSDIDREQIVRDRRPVTADDGTAVGVEPDRFIVIEPGTGKAGQRRQIDVRVVERVVPGDEPRQHARVRRMEIACDQGYPDARDRPHPEPAKNNHVGVTAADEDQILQHRRAVVSRHRCRSAVTSVTQDYTTVACRHLPPCVPARASRRRTPARKRPGGGSRLITTCDPSTKSKK